MFHGNMDALYRKHLKVIAQMQKDGWSNVEPFTLHHHRQVFASIMARRHIPPKTLQRLLGHETFATTMDVYTRFTDDDSKGVEEPLVGFGQ